MSSSLERLQVSHDVRLQWRSFELRPRGGPPITPEYRARILASRPRLEAVAREHYGLELKAGPFGIDSRPALVGAKYAEANGAGAAYHDAVFRAYWQAARSIEEREVLAEIAESVGLDRSGFLEALESELWDGQVTADVVQAFEYGLNGVPALVFAGKYLVSGAQPYELLAEVTEKIQAELSDGATAL